jgi:DNA-binding MarR family transcriptional regulator
MLGRRHVYNSGNRLSVTMATATSTRRPTRFSADLARYVRRGNECAYGNLKLLVRAVGSVYDDALRPLGIRAAQLDLLWAIASLEPVEMSRLTRVTLADQTTLSRTVDRLSRAGLVSVRPGADRRTRLVRTTAAGRRLFARAMPLWEGAQRRVGGSLPSSDLQTIAGRVRKSGAL